MNEKRLSARKAVNVGLVYWLQNKGDRHRIDGASLTTNISGSGILIRMFHLVEVGADIHIKLSIEKKLIDCLGQVVRVDPIPGARAWNVAVELLLKEPDQKTITDYIDKMCP